MADVSLAFRQAKILKSSWEKQTVLKCKEIGGLVLDLNLQHKYFQVYMSSSMQSFFTWKMESRNICRVFPEMNGEALL